MRITRSTLRRIIAEESARILAETKKGHSKEEEDDDYYGDDDPFGDDEALEKGYEYDHSSAGWKKPAEEETAEDDYYGDPDPYGDDEALEMGYEYDGAGGWKKPGLKEGEGKKHHTSPRRRLEAFLKHVGADVDAVMAAVDDAVSRGNDEGADVTSEDITFNLSDDVLDGIPEDESDIWHALLDGVLNDEVDPAAFADAEADSEDWEETKRDLSHPSRFLEEGEEEEGALDEGDPGDDADYADYLQQQHGRFTTPENIPGTHAHKQKHSPSAPAPSHGGGGGGRSGGGWDYSEYDHLLEGDDSNWDDDMHAQSEYQHALDVGPEVAYADYDTGGRNAFTQRGLKGRGPAPRISGDDSDSGDDVMGGGGSAMADYEHAWNIGGGSDEEGFAADYDTGGRNKFTKMGMRGRSGLSEARWAKLAGILKG